MALGFLYGAHRVTDVDREANGSAAVGKAAGNRLTDPPCCVGRELEPLPPIKLLHGMDQAERPFLDQI